MPMFFRENETPAPWRRARDTGEEALSALKRDRVTASLFYPTGFQFPPDYEFSNTVAFADTIAADAAVTLGSTLAVTGASTLTGNVSAGGTLAVTGASTLTGNVSAGGTLGVAGAATLSSTLAVTGNTTVGGTLGVTGVATFTAAPVLPNQGSVTTPAANTAGAAYGATEQTMLQEAVDALRSLLPKIDAGTNVITAA